MSDQIILAWKVDVAGSSFGPTQAASKLSAVPLYVDAHTDPVLGQHFGLTVAEGGDVTTNDATSATRTLTLNMTSANAPEAPPPFPCRPITSTPPTLPYPLRSTKTLPGSFFPVTGSMSVDVTATQIPSLSVGDVIQFLSQEGVFYSVTGVGSTSIDISSPYTGTTGNTGAFKEIAAPVAFDRIAIFSTSELDTGGVDATTPEISAGPGARTVVLTYNDSAGNGPFTIEAELTGKRPVLFLFNESHGIDIAEIVNLVVTSSGGFGNSIGELTVVELSGPLPSLPTNGLPLGTGVGAAETTRGKIGAPVPRTWHTMTDDAQLLIERPLAYLPPSFFALAQQQAAVPPLEGDFIVTTKSAEVPTTVDQTGTLSGGDLIEFAIQPGTLYTIADVTPKIIKLTTPFLGIDTNDTGLLNTPMNNNAQTKGNIGTIINGKPTGARTPSLSGAPPSDDQLSGPLAQFVAPGVAGPPPNPPLKPATMTPPTTSPAFLSDLFTQTIQLALAGVPITPQPITFA